MTCAVRVSGKSVTRLLAMFLIWLKNRVPRKYALQQVFLRLWYGNDHNLAENKLKMLLFVLRRSDLLEENLVKIVRFLAVLWITFAYVFIISGLMILRSGIYISKALVMLQDVYGWSMTPMGGAWHPWAPLGPLPVLSLRRHNSSCPTRHFLLDSEWDAGCLWGN